VPIYEYECGQCGRAFEELVSFGADRKVACPQCGSRNTARKLSVFAARSAEGPRQVPAGPCGRCGDPNGPCSV